jgi:hypothetical protein
MRELRPGVWHWEAQHPEWNERQWWGPLVSSYAIDDGERLVLFDPLSPPPEVDRLPGERETAIVLTCPWHRRDAESSCSGSRATARSSPATRCRDRGDGLQFVGDLENNVPGDRGVTAEALEPLLDLPVEIVLLTLGAPADKAALHRELTP